MKCAIIAITESGIEIGEMISNHRNCTLFTLEKFQNAKWKLIESRLGTFMEKIFKQYNEIIMIMSTGIAVRSIASCLDSKFVDPAVVVCDDTGKYAISLVSGHLGGANHLAMDIAKLIGAVPVITTASDNRKIESVDMLAKRLNLKVDDYEAAKRVTALMVNDWDVDIIDDYGIFRDTNRFSLESKGLIYIGDKACPEIHKEYSEITCLRKKSLVVGIGCRKGIDSSTLYDAVSEIFKTNNLTTQSIKTIATIDIKSEEPAILDLAQSLSVELKIIEKKEILAVEHYFETSDFVQKSIGVGAVCEPAAWLASGKGKKIIGKKKSKGITLCIYQVEGEYEK